MTNTNLQDPSDERPVLEGRLEGRGVPELIHRICFPGRTGTLILSHGEVSKKVYLKAGRLTFATSNVREDRLGETLVRSGMIGYREFEEASRLLAGGKRLGAILVELGYLTPENLVRGVLEHVKEIILGLFPWEHGVYAFVEGPLPTSEVITLNISTPRIIFEGIHRVAAWPRIAAGVGSPRTVLRLTNDGRQIAGGLNLGAAEWLILDMLEEPTPVSEICRGVFLPNFEVYQALWAFGILGISREVEPRPEAAAPADPAGRNGTLADATIGEVLLRLCREGETGILYLTRDGGEKAIHLRMGLVVFATSNRPEDNLTAFLLRRGVIGLRDRDEVERRLLSNKRAGTILREMGILSHDELVRFVGEQLREIMLSVFQWDRGEWRFVGGELPTFEGITLDRPVEEWILHGVRRVRDWARIREGCGELGTVLKLAESPSAALAGVDLGTEEGEVLAALQVPRTVGDICAAVPLSDYRVGQILWALQMVGAVVRAPIEALVPAPEKPVEAAAAHDPISAARDLLEGAPAFHPAQGAAQETGRESAASGAEVAALPLQTNAGLEPEFSERDVAVPEAAADALFEEEFAAVVEEIDRFNAYHGALYGILRSALGARVRNTVANCISGLREHPAVFSGLVPDDMGQFEATSLLDRLKGGTREEARARLSSLLTAESEFAGAFLDPLSLERMTDLFERMAENGPSSCATEETGNVAGALEEAAEAAAAEPAERAPLTF